MKLYSIDAFRETRAALHHYSKLLAAVAKQYAIAHPRWWHVSLTVRPEGIVTDNMPLLDGHIFNLGLDLNRHIINVRTSRGESCALDIRQHVSSVRKEFLHVLNELGCSIETDSLAPAPFDLEYDAQQSEAFFQTLVQIEHIFQKHFVDLPSPVSPVQMWPHGFDLAGEWYGGRLQEVEENGRVQRMPAQINLGFYPGDSDDDSYFYSNPWPFESDQLLSQELPDGARWHTHGWQGSILPYRELLGDPDAERKVLDYARHVFDLAAPTVR